MGTKLIIPITGVIRPQLIKPIMIKLMTQPYLALLCQARGELRLPLHASATDSAPAGFVDAVTACMQQVASPAPRLRVLVEVDRAILRDGAQGGHLAPRSRMSRQLTDSTFRWYSSCLREKRACFSQPWQCPPLPSASYTLTEIRNPRT